MMFEDMQDKDPKKAGKDKDKKQELLPGQTALTSKARTFVGPTDEEIAAEANRKDRARKIAIHKYFIIFLVGMVLALGYKIVQIFNEQTGSLSKRHDRAYVMPKPPTGEAIPIELPFTITIPIENTGNTPAFGVSATLKAHVIKYSLAAAGGVKAEEGEEQVVSAPKSVVIKGGGMDDEIASFRITSAEPLGAEFEQMKTKKGMALNIVGKITYRDSFNAPHFSEFCFGYKSDGKGNVDTFKCPSHHDAD